MISRHWCIDQKRLTAAVPPRKYDATRPSIARSPSQQLTANAKPARWGTAFLVKHENRFFIYNEVGDLIIARLTPAGYEEISRAHLLDPTNRAGGRPVHWSHPAFANQAIYVRNDNELICVDLRAR